MPMINTTASDQQGSIQTMTLPVHRPSWPDGATAAFRDLLGELNAWCRDCGESVVNNAWIAETAVRQTW